MKKRLLVTLAFVLALLAACGGADAAPTPTVVPALPTVASEKSCQQVGAKEDVIWVNGNPDRDIQGPVVVEGGNTTNGNERRFVVPEGETWTALHFGGNITHFQGCSQEQLEDIAKRHPKIVFDHLDVLQKLGIIAKK